MVYLMSKIWWSVNRQVWWELPVSVSQWQWLLLLSSGNKENLILINLFNIMCPVGLKRFSKAKRYDTQWDAKMECQLLVFCYVKAYNYMFVIWLVSEIDKQEGSFLSCMICDCCWHFKMLVLKWRRCWTSITVKDDIVQLLPYVGEMCLHFVWARQAMVMWGLVQMGMPGSSTYRSLPFSQCPSASLHKNRRYFCNTHVCTL